MWILIPFFLLHMHVSLHYALPAYDNGRDLGLPSITQRANIGGLMPPRLSNDIQRNLRDLVQWCDWAIQALARTQADRVDPDDDIFKAFGAYDANILNRIRRRFNAVRYEAERSPGGRQENGRTRRVMITFHDGYDDICPPGQPMFLVGEINEIILCRDYFSLLPALPRQRRSQISQASELLRGFLSMASVVERSREDRVFDLLVDLDEDALIADQHARDTGLRYCQFASALYLWRRRHGQAQASASIGSS